MGVFFDPLHRLENHSSFSAPSPHGRFLPACLLSHTLRQCRNHYSPGRRPFVGNSATGTTRCAAHRLENHASLHPQRAPSPIRRGAATDWKTTPGKTPPRCCISIARPLHTLARLACMTRAGRPPLRAQCPYALAREVPDVPVAPLPTIEAACSLAANAPASLSPSGARLRGLFDRLTPLAQATGAIGWRGLMKRSTCRMGPARWWGFCQRSRGEFRERGPG